jgi:hypothetical protein
VTDGTESNVSHSESELLSVCVCVTPLLPQENLKRPQTGLPDFDHWKIAANPGDAFLGPVVATIYKAGTFPHFTGMRPSDWNCTSPSNCTAVYGGLPQLANLTAHLEQLEVDIKTILPDSDWSGVASIESV